MNELRFTVVEQVVRDDFVDISETVDTAIHMTVSVLFCISEFFHLSIESKIWWLMCLAIFKILYSHFLSPYTKYSTVSN